jgi:hypothetical protein
MLGVLRQLFSDPERGSFASMLAPGPCEPTSPEGQQLLADLASFENVRQSVLGSWDLEIRTSQDVDPPPPLGVFLDWMYGEFLHSDPLKAARIQRVDGPYRLYEFQFHKISERLAILFARFSRVVEAALNAHAA